ncbi:MAG: substrate-binding domain-containing protein [Melioribacteraceae bacterium]|nr:substrate-binding domain-containing protein [Melioribacteraceae bacterium]MCF8354707.1 substrate-binding domain-containing protein [Melioribacteraceae bacterium]MCF8393162.1 substrate-binding domain-containing protein [Melioribacteraceae bacterium]MCF8418065.1 substrate-binding domain-containing protein [Melioribacteraceae bacterium]
MKINSILKSISFFLAVFLILSCGDKEEVKKYVIGFSQCNSAEPWREAMNKEMMKEAENYPEIELLISDGNQDNSKQVADIENFLVREIDLLIVSPNEAQPLTAIVEKVYNQGIAVIVLDRKILSEKYTTFIGADNVIIGEAAGKYAAELLNGKGKIIEIWGLKGSTPAQERHDGFIKGLAGNPGIEIIYEQDGAWLRRKGREIMENALQRFSNIDLVYAHNDPMAMGAYLAAQNAGRENEIYFLGIDALPGAEGGVQAVVNNQLEATFLYPTGGSLAIKTAVKILNNQETEKNITLETETIDSSNAEKYL